LIDLPSILPQLANLDLTPLVLAIVLGGAIGLEREFHGRPAGLRTHIMVCLASTMIIYASRSLPAELVNGSLEDVIVDDPNRLAAGIVTGIGFLGAAAVIRSGDIVRGITTGACVWAVAGLGVAIGQGHYGLAISVAALMLVVLVLFDHLFGWVSPVVYRRLRVRGAPEALEKVVSLTREVLRENRIRVQDLSARTGNGVDQFELVLHVRCRQRAHAPRVLSRLCAEPTVSSAEWSQLSE
jgi:putative Mg2+ transporter-C (MgtC) family protein